MVSSSSADADVLAKLFGYTKPDVLVNWREDSGKLVTTVVCVANVVKPFERVDRRVDLALGVGLVGGAVRNLNLSPLGSVQYLDVKGEVSHPKFVKEYGLRRMSLVISQPFGQAIGCTALYYRKAVAPYADEPLVVHLCDYLSLLKREQFRGQSRSAFAAVAQACANSYHDISQASYLGRATLERNYGANRESWPTGLASVYSKLKQIDRVTDDINKVLKDGLEPSKSKVDVTKVLEDVRAYFGPQFSVTGNKIVLAPIGRPTCRVNRSLLTRTVSNLVENALTSVMSRHSKGGGRVEIRTWVRGNDVFISVKDDGHGVSSESEGKVWAVGYTTKTDARRSKWGLGLSQVKSFAESAGGDVVLLSDVGRGAEFVMRLPRLG